MAWAELERVDKKNIFLFSVMLLTQRIRKSCPQSEIFSLGGQYYGLGQSRVQVHTSALTVFPFSVNGSNLRQVHASKVLPQSLPCKMELVLGQNFHKRITRAPELE